MIAASTLNDIATFARTTSVAQVGWTALVRYIEACTEEQLPRLEKINIQADIHSVRDQIEALIRSAPPPRLNAVYFGLFDSTDQEGTEQIGYYVVGLDVFDHNDMDSLCNPVWRPEGCYLVSEVLRLIKELSVLARNAGKTHLAEHLSYSGALGAAMLISKFASVEFFQNLPLIVGFDSGDAAEV